MEVSEDTLHKVQDNVRAWRIYLNEEVPFDYVDRDWGMDLCEPIYFYWHNTRYLRQCYYNLEEKWDRGGITDDEFECVLKKVIEFKGVIV